MAAAAHLYTNAFLNAFEKKINLNSDAIMCALVSASYTPSQAADAFWSTPQAYELANGNGYTTGGIQLTSPALSVSGTTFEFTAANIQWTNATFSARYGIIYDSTPGTAATDPLIGYVDFGAVQSPSNGTLSINWNASGILTVTAA